MNEQIIEYNRKMIIREIKKRTKINQVKDARNHKESQGITRNHKHMDA